MFSFPLLLKLSKENNRPYIILGPALSCTPGQKEYEKEWFPLKQIDILADAGLGMDFMLGKRKEIITAELKYTAGLPNAKPETDNLYANTISNLNRHALSFTVYYRMF